MILKRITVIASGYVLALILLGVVLIQDELTGDASETPAAPPPSWPLRTLEIVGTPIPIKVEYLLDKWVNNTANHEESSLIAEGIVKSVRTDPWYRGGWEDSEFLERAVFDNMSWELKVVSVDEDTGVIEIDGRVSSSVSVDNNLERNHTAELPVKIYIRFDILMGEPVLISTPRDLPASSGPPPVTPEPTP